MNRFLSFLSSLIITVGFLTSVSYAQMSDPYADSYVHKEGSNNPFEPDDFIKLSNKSDGSILDNIEREADNVQDQFKSKQKSIILDMWVHELVGNSSISEAAQNAINSIVNEVKQTATDVDQDGLIDTVKSKLTEASKNVPSLSGALGNVLGTLGRTVKAGWLTSDLRALFYSQNTIAKDYYDFLKKNYGDDKGIMQAAEEMVALGEQAKKLEELADSKEMLDDNGGELYVYVTESGQRIYFVKKEFSMISNYTSISGTTKGCMPLPAKIAENRSCFFCPLFLTIFNAAQTMATNAFAKLASPIATVLMVGFAIYIAFLVLQHVSSMSAQTSAKFLNSLLAQAMKVGFAFLLLMNPDFVYNKFLGPVLDAGTELGGALLFEEGSGFMEWCSVEENIQSKITEMVSGNVEGDSSARLKEGLIPSYLYVKISCFIRSVQAEISTMQSIGSTLMCVSRNSAAEDNWGGLPDVSMMFQGFVIWIMSLLMSLAFAFYLIDATVRLGIIGALMPFFIACWPFKPTRGYTQKGWQLFLNTFFVYAMMGLVISVNLQLITQGLSTGSGGLDEIEDAINGDNVLVLKDLLDIGFSGFLVLIACCLFAFQLTGKASGIADQFAGGAGENIGSNLGTLAASGAKSAATGTIGLGKKAMQVTGVTAAARKGLDSAKDGIMRSIGLGRYSGKAGTAGGGSSGNGGGSSGSNNGGGNGGGSSGSSGSGNNSGNNSGGQQNQNQQGASNSELEKYRKAIDELNKKIKDLEELIKKQEKLIKDSSGDITNLQRNLNQLNSSLAASRAEVNKFKELLNKGFGNVSSRFDVAMKQLAVAQGLFAVASQRADAAKGTPLEGQRNAEKAAAYQNMMTAQGQVQQTGAALKDAEQKLGNNNPYATPELKQDKQRLDEANKNLTMQSTMHAEYARESQQLDNIIKTSKDPNAVAQAKNRKQQVSAEQEKIRNAIDQEQKVRDATFEKLSNVAGTKENQDRLNQVQKTMDYYEQNKSYYGNKSGRETYEQSISEKTHNDTIARTQREQAQNSQNRQENQKLMEAKQRQIAQDEALLKQQKEQAQKEADAQSKALYEQQVKEREAMIAKAQQELEQMKQNESKYAQKDVDLRQQEARDKRAAEQAAKDRAFYNKFVRPRS